MTDLGLMPGAKYIEEDKSEDIANRLLNEFDLRVKNDDQFDTICEILDRTAVTPKGKVRTKRSLTKVCREIGVAALPEKVKAALLVTLLDRDHFRPIRKRLVDTAKKARSKTPKANK